MSQELVNKKNIAQLRELAKKKSNRKCIDCGLSGPHANVVLSPYNVFVCQTCAGLHRSLSHKVKGVSMSTFSREEVKALEEGGNRRARKIWLALYEEPDTPIKASDTAKVSAKIHETYEKRLYHQERATGKKSGASSKKKLSKKVSEISEQSESFTRSEDSPRQTLSRKTVKKPVQHDTPAIDLLDFSLAMAAAPSHDTHPQHEDVFSAFAEGTSLISDSTVQQPVSAPAPSTPSTPMQGLVEHLQRLMKEHSLSPQDMEKVCLSAMKQVGIHVSSAGGEDLFAQASQQMVHMQDPYSGGYPSQGNAFPDHQQQYYQPQTPLTYQQPQTPSTYQQPQTPATYQQPSYQQHTSSYQQPKESGNPFEDPSPPQDTFYGQQQQQQPHSDNPFESPTFTAAQTPPLERHPSQDMFSHLGPAF